jgi:hypothetical protein
MPVSGEHYTLEASTVSTPQNQAEIYDTPTDVARRLNCHPSGPVRWITKGAMLSDGQRLKLKALRTPGGWRIRRDWLDAFLAALTADRQGGADKASDAAGRSKHSSPDRCRLAAMHAGLSSAGF